VNRAVRYIRHHAGQYGIDPRRLGVTAKLRGSLEPDAGDAGRAGPADAADPVDRESSAVQAVAIFYPVTTC